MGALRALTRTGPAVGAAIALSVATAGAASAAEFEEPIPHSVLVI